MAKPKKKLRMRGLAEAKVPHRLPRVPSRPMSLDIRVDDSRGSELVEIFIESKDRGFNSGPAHPISKHTLRELASKMIAGLNAYRKSGSVVDLRKLAEKGHEAFAVLSGGSPKSRDKWKALLDVPLHLKHSILRVHLQGDLTFPFGLLCTSAPKRDASYKELADQFVGARTVVINSFGLGMDRESELDYLSEDTPCKLIHAVDTRVPGARNEVAYLGDLDGVEARRCTGSEDLFPLWNESGNSVIHFSSHHKYDERTGQYVLTLSRGDTFSVMRDRPRLARAGKPPFLFLNGCNTGVLAHGRPDNVIRMLCPHYAAGIISTIHNIGGEQAAKFAEKYYQSWGRGGLAIDALGKAKALSIFSERDFSAITYEFWEMPEMLKLYKEDF